MAGTTYVCYAGCDLCLTTKSPLTVKGPDDTLFCSKDHRDIYIRLQEPVVPSIRLTMPQKIAHRLTTGHRVSDIMREHKVSYAFVKGIKDELSGTQTGQKITIHGNLFRCSCGSDTFTKIFRTNEYKCTGCNGEYEADYID